MRSAGLRKQLQHGNVSQLSLESRQNDRVVMLWSCFTCIMADGSHNSAFVYGFIFKNEQYYITDYYRLPVYSYSLYVCKGKGKVPVVNSALSQLCDLRVRCSSPLTGLEPAVSCKHSSVMGGRPHLSHILPLPSQRLGRFQFILLGDRGTWVWTTYPELLLGSGQAGSRTRDLSIVHHSRVDIRKHFFVIG